MKRKCPFTGTPRWPDNASFWECVQSLNGVAGDAPKLTMDVNVGGTLNLMQATKRQIEPCVSQLPYEYTEISVHSYGS